MLGRRRHRHAVAIAAAAVVLFPREALAYLDPGTGSMMVQALVAGLAAAAYAFRSSLTRLTAFLFRRAKPTRHQGAPPDTR